jgi:prepilin-type N-terminal cleavage/methylation domain-containing protein
MRKGVTLVEIVIGIALLAILGGVVVIEMNPFKQIASSRNTQRSLHLQAIMNGVRQNITESGTNSFTCAAGSIPSAPTRMKSSGGYDIAPCLVPTYLATLPYDPKDPSAGYASPTSYDTGYTIARSTSTGQVTLSAPSAEIGQAVNLTR